MKMFNKNKKAMSLEKLGKIILYILFFVILVFAITSLINKFATI